MMTAASTIEMIKKNFEAAGRLSQNSVKESTLRIELSRSSLLEGAELTDTIGAAVSGNCVRVSPGAPAMLCVRVLEPSIAMWAMVLELPRESISMGSSARSIDGALLALSYIRPDSSKPRAASP